MTPDQGPFIALPLLLKPSLHHGQLSVFSVWGRVLEDQGPRTLHLGVNTRGGGGVGECRVGSGDLV